MTNRKAMVFQCLIILCLCTIFLIPFESQADVSFTFAFAGDTGQYGASFGSGQNGTSSFVNSAASLQALTPGLSFFVDDGAISYTGNSSILSPKVNEDLCCNLVMTNS